MTGIVDVRLALIMHIGVNAVCGLVLDRFTRRRLISLLLALAIGILGGSLWFDASVNDVIRSPIFDGFSAFDRFCSFLQFWLTPLATTYLVLRLQPEAKESLRRLWMPRYTLRCLLLTVTAFALVCSAVATVLMPLRREQAAARLVEDSGGQAYWSGGHVTAVYLNDATIEAAAVKALDRFPELGTVILSRAKVTDGDVALIGNLPKLEILELDGTQITDKSVTHLGELRSLKVLDLSNTQVSEDGVRKIKQSIRNATLDIRR